MKPNLERINYEMDRQKLTPRALARLAGLSHQLIYTIKSGKKNTSLSTLDAIAKALNVEPKDLII